MKAWKKGAGERISLFLLIPLILQIVLIYYLFEKSYQHLEIILNIGSYFILGLALYYNGWAEKFDLLIRSGNAMNIADRLKIQSEVMGKLLLFAFLLAGFVGLVSFLFGIKAPFAVESMVLGSISATGVYRLKGKKILGNESYRG